MEERFQVGVVSSTHGLRGEVKVFPTTDDVRRFKKLKAVMMDMGNEMKVLEIEGVKFFKKFAILKFKGMDRLEEAEKYKGKSLWVNRKDAVKPGKDEYFIADLMGMTVTDETGNRLGKLVKVIETGANDVYVVDMGEGKEVLLPAIRECVLEVDVERQKMKVHVMDGLLG